MSKKYNIEKNRNQQLHNKEVTKIRHQYQILSMNYEKLKIKFADINTSNSPNMKQLSPVLKNIVDNAGKPSYGRRWIDESEDIFRYYELS